MSTRDQMTQFPPNSKSNPGKTDILEDKEKQKFTQREQDKAPKPPKTEEN